MPSLAARPGGTGPLEGGKGGTGGEEGAAARVRGGIHYRARIQFRTDKTRQGATAVAGDGLARNGGGTGIDAATVISNPDPDPDPDQAADIAEREVTKRSE